MSAGTRADCGCGKWRAVEGKVGVKKETNSFRRSSWDFLGRMSSMCGARRGYVSRILVRMPRWTEDLTLVLAPGTMLVGVNCRLIAN